MNDSAGTPGRTAGHRTAGHRTAVRRTAFVNARLLDPASGLDAPGALVVEDGRIADLGPGLLAEGVSEGLARIDCGGAELFQHGGADLHPNSSPGLSSESSFDVGDGAAAGA